MRRVRNFTYNGFSGQLKPGYAVYTARFKKWTSDPGIAICECSDDKERLIPTFALEEDDYPEQTYEGGKLMFGPPCMSDC